MDLGGKTILVTGADGFIGSHLVEQLLGVGCSVRAFVCYNSFNSWGWLDTFPRDVLAQLDVIAGDVRDPHGVRQAARGADVILHLAALIAIPYSYHSPDAYVDTNVKGTLNILQAARDHDVARVLVTSTSEVYGTAQYVPIDERHPFQGQSPYSASKIGADRIAESFHKSFGTPVIIARPFNTYGPRQSARAVIPTIISQVLGGARTIKLGSLHPTRDFNYVGDTCRGMVALAQCDAAVGREVNIGSGTECSIHDLVETLLACMDAHVAIEHDAQRVRPQASEVDRLVCDNRHIRELTDWTPQISLREGLVRTVEWMRKPEHLSRYRHEHYNV